MFSWAENRVLGQESCPVPCGICFALGYQHLIRQLIFARWGAISCQTGMLKVEMLFNNMVNDFNEELENRMIKFADYC